MGGVEIGRSAYRRRLAYATHRTADWNALPEDLSPQQVLDIATGSTVVR